jgi:gamma-glutamylcyclotransferase (GGCT)/AIG2-like uncharacterized protein YtfP
MEIDILLFIYGTLQEPEVQENIIGRLIDGKEDILENFKKSKIAIDDIEYPVIKSETGSIVKGQVIAISLLELEKIDIYETDAYIRSMVTLKSGLKTWVYHQ